MNSTPSSWDGEDTYYILVKTIPKKVMFEKTVFEGIIPIMTSFFEYLGQNIIDKTWADELKDSIAGKEELLLNKVKFMQYD